MDINYLMESGKVKRFHTEHTIQTQTVGDHTWGVVTLVDYFFPQARKEMILAAHYHDASEKEIGDTPAPVKWQNPAVKEALYEAEERARWYKQIPMFDLFEYEIAAIKVCDYLELMHHCLIEMKLGNQWANGPFNRVKESLDTRIRELEKTCFISAVPKIQAYRKELQNVASKIHIKG